MGDDEVKQPATKIHDASSVADFSASEFATIIGAPHRTQRSVMPVVAVRGDLIRSVGTCFAVSNHGIVLTARHVVDEALSPHPKSGLPPDGWWIGGLYAAPETDDDTSHLVGGVIPARSVHRIPILDIAAMHLNLPVNVRTGKTPRMPLLRLSPAIPALGSRCIAMGYHLMSWEKSVLPGHAYKVVQSYSASRGVINQIYFPHRDSVTHTFPCFEVSARYDPGMSGAPVIGDQNVIGVVCSSFGGSDEQGYISYASLIGTAMFLQIEAQEGPAFLYDFCIGGSVSLDATATSLAITRSADTLEIDFGRPPVISNRLGA
jgi:Trypsin-like peptidase domain